MKKYLSIFALLLAGFLTIAATAMLDDDDVVKKYMVIHHKDAKSDTIFIEDVDSIEFGDSTIHTPKVLSVEFSSDSLKIEEGSSDSLSYYVNAEEGADRTCTITLSNNIVASYDGYQVTALAEGMDSIFVTSSDGIHADTCVVTVVKKPVIDVTGISVSIPEISLNINDTVSLIATVLPDNATDKSVRWSSSDESIATVDATGLVTAIADGTASIVATASDGIHTDECKVTVQAPEPSEVLTGVHFSFHEWTLYLGQPNKNVKYVSLITEPKENLYYLIKEKSYSLTDNSVAKLELYGNDSTDLSFRVTALKPGKTTLNVTINGEFSDSIVFTVPQDVTNVTLSDSLISIMKGDSIQLNATVEPETATDKTVIWASSDEKIATVSSTGMVTGTENGKATITAKAGDKIATCEVEVTYDTIHVESVTFASDSVSVDSAETINLEYVLAPSRATVKTVIFTSDDETIATVSEAGEVTGKKVGETIVRISSVDKPSAVDSCVVTVNYVEFGVKLLEPSSDSEYTATVPFKLKGDMSRVIGCGIDYSLDQDLKDTIRVYAIDFAPDKSEYSISLEGLKSHTTYYYHAFAMLNDSDSTEVYSDTVCVTTMAPDPFKAPAEGVNLDLPSGKLWSPYNMGAQQEADYGRLVSWGDVTGTAVPSSQYKKVSADFISGDTSYDFATKHWGGKWHMPTMTEWEELFLNTERTLVTITDTDGVAEVTGWKFTGKNGNSIFLPCSGMSKGGSISETSEIGYYWTGETNSWDESEIPTYATVDSETYGYGFANGYLGYSIRPVYGDVSGKFDPYGTDDSDKTGESAEASRSVDMGNGIRWAICNVGATDKKDYSYGDYFAWGDINPNSPFSQANYHGYDASRTTNKGYEDYGSDISGNAKYDAATYHWGGKWRMPTDDEFYTLMKRDKWVWTSMNGVYGYRVYGYDDCSSHSIFFPAAGEYNGDELSEVGTHGYYWSSTEYTIEGKYGYVAYAYYLSFSSTKYNPADFFRYFGQSIRPVKTK